jgi:PAS domain S-box-containing protein
MGPGEVLRDVYPITLPDGSFWIDATFAPLATSSGAPESFVAFARDITEQKLSEIRLKENEEKYRALVENVDAAVFAVDENGVFRFMNRTGATYLGKRPEEIIGRPMGEVFPKHVADMGFANARKVVEEGQAVASTVAFLVEGEQRLFRFSLFPFRDDDGKISLEFGVARDITEEKRAQQKAEEREAAIREVLNTVRAEKSEVGQSIQANIDELLMPILENLESELSPRQRGELEMAMHVLSDITSPFVAQLSSGLTHLTPMETRICRLIRDGMASKDIARLQGISLATVSKHRERIRHKLGIANQSVNLASYLQSMLNDS